MEDGAKEDPAQCQKPQFLGKAGWVKKATTRLLGGYKDRYVHVERTEIVVYENEDLNNCLERLDLENYDECHEIKSSFKRKHRLILIRSPKSGNKIHDMKFQAQNAEEKTAWIKALCDGINRAKNKVFDEVKVDECSNLEHVTRTRPKGNRNRRPPTRIHMKEVAGVSSDGILRLDLDLEDAVMPNGTHHANVDGSKTPNEAKKVSVPSCNVEDQSVEEEAQTEPEDRPQKKVIKPPMPPIKVPKPIPALEKEPDQVANPISTTEKEPDKDDDTEKVLKPTMDQSSIGKPCASPIEEASDEIKAEKMSEKSPDTRKKTAPPPTPSNKPITSSTSGLAETSQSSPNPRPPTPPSKEKKPSHPSAEANQEGQSTPEENKEKEHDSNGETGTTVEKGEVLPSVRDDTIPCTEGQMSDDEESDDDRKMPFPLLPVPTESPILLPKKNPPEVLQLNTQHIEDNKSENHVHEASTPCLLRASEISLQAEEAPPEHEVPVVVVSLNDPVIDSHSQNPLLCHISGEKKNMAEKSADSSQHSDSDSEGSWSEDTMAASTAVLTGSTADLNVSDTSVDKIHSNVCLRPATIARVRSNILTCSYLEPTFSLKSSTKVRSASSGDLLSDSSVSFQVRQHTGRDRAPGDDVMKLETELALEMEKTSELLCRVSQSPGNGNGENMPEDLLVKAMEKLKKADHVLREVKKLKLEKSSSNRKSW